MFWASFVVLARRGRIGWRAALEAIQLLRSWHLLRYRYLPRFASAALWFGLGALAMGILLAVRGDHGSGDLLLYGMAGVVVRSIAGIWADKGNPYSHNAKGTGAVDDRQAFVDADAVDGPMTISPGFFLIGTSLTIESDVQLQAGAVLKPAAGANIHFAKSFNATFSRHIDLSLGGTVTFSQSSRPEVFPQWWGAVGDGVTDDRTPVYQADQAGSPFFMAGTYRIASALTLTKAAQWAPDAKIKPDNVITVTVGAKPYGLGPYHIFDISAGGVVTFNDTGRPLEVFPEMWGAVPVYSDGANADAFATTNRKALQACVNTLSGNVLAMSGQYVVDRDEAAATITVNAIAYKPAVNMPVNVSYVVRAAAGSHASGALRGKTTAGGGTHTILWNITSSGPQVIFDNVGCVGPSSGDTRDIGFRRNSNGVALVNCWPRGLRIGDLIQGSFNRSEGGAIEYCDIGMQFDTLASEESQFQALTFYNNVSSDVRMVGINMRGTVFQGSTHIGTVGQCFDIDGASHWLILAVQHSPGGNSNAAHTLRMRGNANKGRAIGIKATTGTNTIFFEGAQDCRISDVDVDGAARAIYVVNASTVRCGVQNWRVSGATVAGVDADSAGAGNWVSEGYATGCAIGLRLAMDLFELRHCEFTGNTADFSNPIALGLVYAFNVRMGVYGNFYSELAATAGKVYAIAYLDHMGRKVMYGAAAPTGAVAFMNVDDVVWRRGSVPGGAPGWVCTTAGAPGTWKAMPNLAP